MDFDSALKYIQSLEKFGIKLGNERIEAILERLGNPHRKFGVAHVAGTKGKGSTTTMIAAILKAHGFRTGGYFSPYVYDICERVQVDGSLIPRQDLARLVTEIAPVVESVAGTELGQATEFELKTAIGFKYFAEQGVDFAAVEVGIGGRLDATNVVSPLVCVITNIGLDHMHILGDTHEKIAAEKAGIIKPGVPVITAADDPDALNVISSIANDRSAPLVRVIPEEYPLSPPHPLTHSTTHPLTPIEWSERPDGLCVQTPRGCYSGLRLRMQGRFQYPNAACAIAAVEVLAEASGFPVSENALREGLLKAYVPGRLEIVHERPLVVMDGAHNTLAARALVDEVRRMSYQRLLLVIGMAAGHEPERVVSELAPLSDRVYATQPTWDRGLPAERIARIARQYCNEVRIITPPLAAAKEALQESRPEDLVLITGSFYVVGDIPPGRLLNR